MGKKARKTESNPSEDEYESENNDENVIDSEEELEESVNDESSDNESIIVKDDDIMNNILHKNKKKLVIKENRISINRLTKYELVRILGQRTKQLIMGAKPLVKTNKPLLPDKMAEYELKLNLLAKSCLCPGLVALITNLIFSSGEEPENKDINF